MICPVPSSHDHIKANWVKLKGKVVLDCHNICPDDGLKYFINIEKP